MALTQTKAKAMQYILIHPGEKVRRTRGQKALNRLANNQEETDVNTKGQTEIAITCNNKYYGNLNQTGRLPRT